MVTATEMRDARYRQYQFSARQRYVGHRGL